MYSFLMGTVAACITMSALFVVALAVGMSMMGPGRSIGARWIKTATIVPLLVGPVLGWVMVNQSPISLYTQPSVIRVTEVNAFGEKAKYQLVTLEDGCRLTTAASPEIKVSQSLSVYEFGGVCTTDGRTRIDHAREWQAVDWLGWSLCFIPHVFLIGAYLLRNKQKPVAAR